MKSAALLFLLVVAGSALGQERYPPEPADLQAGYCFGVVKLAQNRAADHQRLQAYLAGRLRHIDSTGVIYAAKQAEIDVAQGAQSIKECWEKAPSREAAAACDAPPAIARKIARCQSLDFLPY